MTSGPKTPLPVVPPTGSRTPLPGYVPIYRIPPDLIGCTKADGTTGRGRSRFHFQTGQLGLFDIEGDHKWIFAEG